MANAAGGVRGLEHDLRDVLGWRGRGVWQTVMAMLNRSLRTRAGPDAKPSLLMVMVDCQVVKGGRWGKGFYEAHFKYRLRGAKRAVAIDYLGLPGGCECDRRPHA